MNATTNKAPVGGMVSAVNGQFYEGGEFMPDHGKFCGKGKNKVTKVEFDAAAEMATKVNMVLSFNEVTGDFALKNFGGNILYRARNLNTLAKTLRFYLENGLVGR